MQNNFSSFHHVSSSNGNNTQETPEKDKKEAILKKVKVGFKKKRIFLTSKLLIIYSLQRHFLIKVKKAKKTDAFFHFLSTY
jgi:hypothetical protein